jgi:hypothetical protein
MTNDNATEIKKPAKVKKRKKHVGLILLVIVVLVLAAIAGVAFRVPQKIGLVKSPAERLFTETPDGVKADAVMENLKATGLNTKGVEVYVLPVAGTEDNVAIVVLDASKGFSFSGAGSVDPVKAFMTVVAKAQQDGINRAAVAYYDESGKELATVTVPSDAVVAYSQKKLTDRQLMEKVDIGAGDLAALIKQVQAQLK